MKKHTRVSTRAVAGRWILLLTVAVAVFIAGLATSGSEAVAQDFSRRGVDYSSTKVDWPAFFRELKATGRDFIGRYLPVEGAAWRRVTTAELEAATAAGVDYFFWLEDSGNHGRATEGFAAGVADAHDALAALASLGVPTTTPVYYTVDFNLTDGSLIDAYFRGVGSVVPLSQIGVYGEYDAVDWVYQHGLATYLCQTTAWLDSRGWHPYAQMRQNTATYKIGGIYVDRLTVTAPDFGQCRRREEPDPRIRFSGHWDAFLKEAASAGSYTRSSTSGASATIYFTGTRLDWIASKGTTTGKADVYLDGVKVTPTPIDLAAATATYRVKVWSTGVLPEAQHKVEIVRSPASASGKYLTVDAVDVVGSLSYGPPGITALTPAFGAVAGGTSVTISGTGFVDVTAVTFDGVPATSYTVHSPTQITALAPAHAEGAARVQVSTAGGSSEDTASDDFTYSDTAHTVRYEQTDPHLVYSGTWDSFAKTSASGGSYGRSATGGASATIYFTGTRLDWIAMKGTSTGKADVYVDGAKVTPTPINLAAATATYQVKVWSSGTLSKGSHTVRIVRNSASAVGKYLTLDAIEVVGSLGHAPPAVSGVAPASGAAAGGTSVAISGAGFTDVTAVTFGGTPAASYVANSSGQITAVAPAHAVGTVDVVVTTAWGSSSPTGTANNYAYLPRHEQTDPLIVYSGAWDAFYKEAASGGSYGRSTTSGASATIYFTGTRLDWIATKGTTTGKADVYLDGVKMTPTPIDLAAATATYQVKVWSTGILPEGKHTVQIVRSPASAAGKFLTVDAVDIWGTIESGP